MKKIIFSLAIAVSIFGFVACSNEHYSDLEGQKTDSILDQSRNIMNTYISIFEIPATDISRAIGFYESILGIKIEKMDFPGMEMGVLPYEEQVITGVIVKGEGYTPSADGVTIYLNGGDNLQFILDKVEENGGEIIVPKTAHADESGYFAIFLDTEGNKLGLHSVN